MDAELQDEHGQTYVRVGQRWRSKQGPTNMKVFLHRNPPPNFGGPAEEETGDIGYLPKGYEFEVQEIRQSEKWTSVRIEFEAEHVHLRPGIDALTSAWVNVWKRGDSEACGNDGQVSETDIGLMVAYPIGYKVPQRPWDRDGTDGAHGGGGNRGGWGGSKWLQTLSHKW